MAASSSAPALADPAELPSSTKLFLYGALTVQTLISAGTYLAAKRAMVELDPITLVSCRFGLSAAVFVLILLVTPGRKVPPLKALKSLLLLGFLAGPLNQGLFFYGLSKSTPAHAALLYALTPITVYLISTFRGHERVSRRALLGILSAFLGVATLLLARGLASATGPMFGDLFILGAVVAWAFYTSEGKTFIAEHGPIRSTAWSMTTAALLIVPVLPFAFDAASVANAGRTTLWCIAYLALLTSVLSYMLWYFALSKTKASKVAVFSNLQPVATALAAWAVLGDPLHWEIAVGGALVLAGVRLTQSA